MPEKTVHLGHNKVEFKYKKNKNLIREATVYSIKIEGNCIIGDDVYIGHGVTIGEGTTIGNNVSIGAHTYLHGLMDIGNKVTIGDEVTIHPSVKIGKRATIGDNVLMKNSVKIGRDCNIGYRVNLEEFSTLGDKVTIGPYSNFSSFIDIGDKAIIGCGTTLFYGAKIKAGWEVNRVQHEAFKGKNHVSAFYIGKELMIQMGCYTRTLKEWEQFHWSNDEQEELYTDSGIEVRTAYDNVISRITSSY